MQDRVRNRLYRRFLTARMRDSRSIIKDFDHIPAPDRENHSTVVKPFGKRSILGTQNRFLNGVDR